MNIFEVCAFIAKLGLIWQLSWSLHPDLPTMWFGVGYFFTLAMGATIIGYSYEEYYEKKKIRRTIK